MFLHAVMRLDVFFALSSVFVLLAPFYTCVLIQFGIFCCFHVLRVFLRTVVGIRVTCVFLSVSIC